MKMSGIAIGSSMSLNVYDRDYNELIKRLNQYQKRMIIVGQMNLIYLFEKKYSKLLYKHFAWLTEHISNQTIPGIPVKNFDVALYAMDEDTQEKMVPELLITWACGFQTVEELPS